MKLKKEDFPIEFMGVTIDFRDSRLVITQDDRLGREHVSIPVHNNGWFDFANSGGKEYMVLSSGYRVDMGTVAGNPWKKPWKDINWYIGIVESLARPDLEE